MARIVPIVPTSSTGGTVDDGEVALHALSESAKFKRNSRFKQCLYTTILQQPPTTILLPLKWYKGVSQSICACVIGGFLLCAGAYFHRTARSMQEIVVPYKFSDGAEKLFRVDRDISEDVFVYYELPHVMMNHKTFVESKDKRTMYTSLSSASCEGADSLSWLNWRRETDVNFTARLQQVAGSGIQPCGLVSFSFFTDQFELYTRPATSGHSVSWEPVPMDSSDLAVPADAEAYKGKISVDSTGRLEIEGAKSWLTESDYERWKVWARTPVAPHVRNLYGVIRGGLKQGEYKLEFVENSPIWEQWGVEEKRVVLSEKHVFGGKGCFIFMSGFCVALGCLESIAFFVFLVKGLL
eukprot:TRINITY_DN59946_c0_g1_i1.p1 TRINITY_DN59946_c0_g1~~TRINITY_DN59946_c0_g1_i1.p1  ORF type:complete len:353 (-),score=41.88 TRINITY_DN59946_c0_g1_i1:39-1097(-)